MTDDQRSTEEFAWVRQAYAALPGTEPEAVERAVAATMAAVSSAAIAQKNGAAVAKLHRLGGRKPWVRWSPWISLIAAVCLVVVLGEWWHRTMARSKVVAALSETPLFSSAIPSDSPSRRAHASMSAREPSAHSDATPSTPTPAHSPTVAMLPHTGHGDTASPPLVAPSPTPPVAPARPTFQERAVDGLDSASATLVLHILDSAQALSLPIDGVAARVREGVRRGVPPPQIVLVARNYVASLNSARTALGASATVAELQAGAEALLAGASSGGLKQLRSARPTGSLVESLIALADLSTHGVAPTRASTAIAALVARDGSDARVRALRAAVIGDIVRGVLPNAALADRVRHSGNSDLPPLRGRADSIPIHRWSP